MPCCTGAPGYINDLLDELRAVTAEDTRVACTRLTPPSRAVVAYLTRESAEAA